MVFFLLLINVMILSYVFIDLWYYHMCLLIWTVFSGERCGPWACCFFIAMLIKCNYKFYNEYMYCYRYKQLNNFVQCFCRMCHPCPRWTSSRPFLPPSYRRVSPRCPSSRGVQVSSSRESRSISWSRLREEQPASRKDESLSSLCYI